MPIMMSRSSGSHRHLEKAGRAGTAWSMAAGMLHIMAGQWKWKQSQIVEAAALIRRSAAESMVPNIDPEQVRYLAGWGLTQNDRANFVG